MVSSTTLVKKLTNSVVTALIFCAVLLPTAFAANNAPVSVLLTPPIPSEDFQRYQRYTEIQTMFDKSVGSVKFEIKAAIARLKELQRESHGGTGRPIEQIKLETHYILEAVLFRISNVDTDPSDAGYLREFDLLVGTGIIASMAGAYHFDALDSMSALSGLGATLVAGTTIAVIRHGQRKVRKSLEAAVILLDWFIKELHEAGLYSDGAQMQIQEIARTVLKIYRGKKRFMLDPMPKLCNLLLTRGLTLREQ